MIFLFKTKCDSEAEIIWVIHGEGTANDRTCQKWLVKFLVGNFSLNEAPRTVVTVEIFSVQMKYK